MKKRRYQEKRPRLGAMAERKSETIPSYTRILSRHGLCPADLPVSDAFDLFTKVSADPEVIALKPKALLPRVNILHLYSRTASALEKMSDKQKVKLLQRIAVKFTLSGVQSLA